MKHKNELKYQNTPVAIIGMECFFPKSSDLKEYWRLLYNGEDGITDIPETHWSPEDYFDKDQARPDHVYAKRGGFLSPVKFDPLEFGIPPSNLQATDTSQLLALIAAKRALEKAGYGGDKEFNRDKTGVIIGVTGTQELVIPLGARLGYPVWRKALENSGVDHDKTEEVIKRISESYLPWQENSFPGLLGNVVAGRICNRLNLGGTNCVVDAACASSMAALNMAVMELVSGKSDMVVTGGVDTLNDIFMHMCFAKTHILSPSGDIRPFSKNADGTLLGEGVGILVLKRLADAKKDGDRIYAVIKGIGTSSDGKSQSIYAPNAKGQAKALREAYENADVDPGTVELLEAHGTGTMVGDLVEFNAVKEVFGQSENQSEKKNNWCAIGSVKSMIGHTKAAAGSAGLIKAALSLYNKVLLPTLKADEPDPKLEIDKSPFYINSESRPWFSKNGNPRRAGISSFGFGGSNFHVIMEEYLRDKEEVLCASKVEIISFSSSSLEGLKNDISEFKKLTVQSFSKNFFAEKTFETRKNFSSKDPYRLLITVKSLSETDEDLSLSLEQLFDEASALMEKIGLEGKSILNTDNVFLGCGKPSEKIAFVFPGQGSQYVNMGRDIICSFPESFKAIETANSICGKQANANFLISDFIFPRLSKSKKETEKQKTRLQKTDIAQPAIGAVSLAMLKILQRFGIKPDAVCGHSFGELTALCAAGWIDEETFLNLAAIRGKLMADAGKSNEVNNGAMLAVNAPLDELEKLVAGMDNRLIIANRNSPRQGVLSGSLNYIEEAQKICLKKGFSAIRLPVSAAFHSSLVEEAAKPFGDAVNNFNIIPTDMPVFSNTTAGMYPADSSKARALLANQILSPVNFTEEIENLYTFGINTFVEVGPKPVLSGLIKSILRGRDCHIISLDSSSGKDSGIADIARALCMIASTGSQVDLKKWECPIGSDLASLNQVKPVNNAKGKMAVQVSGANFKVPTKNNQDKVENYKNKNFTPQAVESSKEPEIGGVMYKDKKDSDHNIIDSLKLVREGMDAICSIQMQTAETHKKFLETQAEASRTLHEMMESVRSITETSSGADNKKDIFEKKEIFIPDNLTAQALEVKPEPAESLKAISVKDEVKVDPEEAEKAEKVQDIITGVVSELTGYPPEMLEPDMDIETDLGIDSIKRVEIFSLLEEKMPGLPSVSPDMGSIKTLGQIAEYLKSSSGSKDAGLEYTDLDSEEGRSKKIKAETKDPKAEPESEKVQDIITGVVSQLTGYPPEMLEPDMDIETDLGIDSIKRVEIFSLLEEKMPGLPSVSPEDMGSIKTLGQIAEYLKSSSDYKQTGLKESGQENIEEVKNLKNISKEEINEASLDSAESVSDLIDRKKVCLVETPLKAGKSITIPADKKIFITDDKAGLSLSIADELALLNINTVVISHDILKYRKDFPKAAGLILIPKKMDAGPDYDPDNDPDNNPDKKHEEFLKNVFMLTSHIAGDLIKSAKNGGAVFATITGLDGAFGFKGGAVLSPVSGGLAGLAKTASIEWEQVSCHALDIDPAWKNNREIAKAVVAEILNDSLENGIETGLGQNIRYKLKLQSAPYADSESVQAETALNPGEPVVITGGARGITANCAFALAKYERPVLVLIGRSPALFPEPEWLAPLDDKGLIKKAILENEKPVTPAELEKLYARYMANREIAKNIKMLKSMGEKVYYYSADIRDYDRISVIFNEVRDLHGPIKGIIHGAGVLEDRLITDKTKEQYEKVFSTKVDGLRALLAAAKDDDLKYLILFSSISARVGNMGQADYAMANEVLNKIAHRESNLRSGCRVVSINWGPWDGGMVSDTLKNEFKKNNIGMIPVDTGAMCMLYEMKRQSVKSDNQNPEVVIGAKSFSKDEAYQENSHYFKGSRTSEKQPDNFKPVGGNNNLSLIIKREIDVNSYPVLKSHVLGGRPVVPFALMTEWISHSALHENPGLLLYGIDDMRILKGIALEKKNGHRKKLVHMFTGKAVKKGLFFEVDVEIRDGVKKGMGVIHSRAKAILTSSLSHKSSGSALRLDPDELKITPYARTMDDVYENILFHGDKLRGIRKITSCSEQFMLAEIDSAPLPGQWMSEPLRSRWIADPLIIDSAFQMATIWTYEKTGMFSLPGYCATYRQYQDRFPSKGVKVLLEINDVSARQMKGDFTFLDEDKNVVARLTGYEATMDASLALAFKRE